eukprot:1482789-Rhodomonas_salina.1
MIVAAFVHLQRGQRGRQAQRRVSLRCCSSRHLDHKSAFVRNEPGSLVSGCAHSQRIASGFAAQYDHECGRSDSNEDAVDCHRSPAQMPSIHS